VNPSRHFILKICGLREIAHLRVAEACGATHFGLLVEVTQSPRCVSRRQARVLARAARARPVMVTMLDDPAAIVDLARTVQPAVVQHHGEPSFEPEAVRRELPGTEFWQVVSVEVGPDPDLLGPAERIRAAAATGADRVVLDAARSGQSGGLGVAMDWEAAAQLVEAAGEFPILLAGGLSPDNVAEAIGRVRPAGVDVSSGVETGPNAKSPRLIRAFCEAVRLVTVPARARKRQNPETGSTVHRGESDA